MKASLLPFTSIVILLIAWQIGVSSHPDSLLPDPSAVVLGIVELAKKGLLVKYIVASLFRVTWGYVTAAMLAIPFGLLLGWYHRGEQSFNPLIQIFRPISPLAWIPISILWFGTSDMAAVYLIFLAS